MFQAMHFPKSLGPKAKKSKTVLKFKSNRMRKREQQFPFQFTPCSSVSIVNFVHIIAGGWVVVVFILSLLDFGHPKKHLV